jgi:hypothetical protein
MKRIKVRRREGGREGGRAFFVIPVKIASSTLKATTVRTLTSAGTWSPSFKSIMSPGTSSSAGTLGRGRGNSEKGLVN